MDENIKRFCKLVVDINESNEKLDDYKENFYDGGHSFEEVYKSDIDQLSEMEKDFKILIRVLTI